MSGRSDNDRHKKVKAVNKKVNIDNLLGAMVPLTTAIDSTMRQDLEGLRGETDDLLLEILEYGLFNGGKRIRPLLVVLAARLCGDRSEEVHRLAVAFEYLHAATLFHDDVIDNAETRRGRAAVNCRYGLVAAILAGDFLHARAMKIVGEITGREGLSIFCEATGGMVDGEFMQLRNASRFNLSEPDYYQAIMGKTGLLIAAACEIGALHGGGDRDRRQRLREYGVGLGSAFQMVDDLLDYTGDTAKTGKPVGGDLAEGKMTLPLIVAMAGATKKDREQLEAILRDPRARKEQTATVVDIIERYQGFNETKHRAVAAVEKAIGQLDAFETSPDRAILEGLAHYVLRREK